MATRTLDQVLASLDSVYNPQIEQIRQRQGLIPGQLAEEEKGLQAKQEQAFGDILGGARRRGLGFSGIPLAEQAKYTSTEFLPAIARLRQQGKEQAMSLEDAILGIQEKRSTFGNQLYQQELSQDLAERQFQESIRQFNEQLAAQARERAAAAAAANKNILAGIGGGQGGQVQAAQSGVDASTQKAYNDVKSLLSKDAARIQREYSAIKASAGYGNAYDRLKLQLIEQLYPAARNFGKNTVGLGQSKPTAVNLNPSYSGLSVGVANPNLRLR